MSALVLYVLLLFRNKFNKFNYTGTRMLESIYHMTLKLLCYISCSKNGII